VPQEAGVIASGQNVLAELFFHESKSQKMEGWQNPSWQNVLAPLTTFWTKQELQQKLKNGKLIKSQVKYLDFYKPNKQKLQ
jgi:hypothetical protein